MGGKLRCGGARRSIRSADLSEPEKLRADTVEELRRLVLVARSDHGVARYETSPRQWLDLYCAHGHLTELIEWLGNWRCKCRSGHWLYRCEECGTDFHYRAYGRGCGGPPYEPLG